MATLSVLKRIFRFGATDLPDPNPALTPESVLEHYANGPFPQLVGGKISAGNVEGDARVYTLSRNTYKANG